MGPGMRSIKGGAVKNVSRVYAQESFWELGS